MKTILVQVTFWPDDLDNEQSTTKTHLFHEKESNYESPIKTKIYDRLIEIYGKDKMNDSNVSSAESLNLIISEEI